MIKRTTELPPGWRAVPDCPCDRCSLCGHDCCLVYFRCNFTGCLDPTACVHSKQPAVHVCATGCDGKIPLPGPRPRRVAA
jgi:hypothetical protein